MSFLIADIFAAGGLNWIEKYSDAYIEPKVSEDLLLSQVMHRRSSVTATAGSLTYKIPRNLWPPIRAPDVQRHDPLFTLRDDTPL